jgi:hypothetical protein
MNMVNLKLIGVIGGVILMLGVLLIGSQYVSDFTGGASADVVNYDQLPPEIAVTSEQYRQALEMIDEYQAKDDLASKNEVVQRLKEGLAGWVK